jgi:dTDP-4-amino-4,6-dideoxygalactose transaminase
MAPNHSVAPNVYDAEPIPEAARAEIDRLLTSGDLFRYTAPEDAPVALLEQEFADLMGTKYALAVSSCSAAIFLSLRALDLKPGARVLIPAFTFAAVPSAVVHADCQPVLVEVGENYRIDIADFAAKLDDDIAAVIISHMRGHTSDMDAIMGLCDARGIPVIEDAAHSLGTLWHGRKIGTIGAIGCFSFQSYKLVNAGEGGILITDDADLVARAVIMSGAYEHNWKKHKGPEGQNDPELAEAFARWQNMLPLYNMRMQNLSAAVIRPQLPRGRAPRARRAANHDYVAERLNTSHLDERSRRSRPRGSRAGFHPVQPGGHAHRRPCPRLRRCRRRARDQGAGLRSVDRQRTRLLELELHPRGAPRSAADPRDADARLRRPPARPAEKAGSRFHRRRADRGSRGCHGGGAAGLRDVRRLAAFVAVPGHEPSWRRHEGRNLQSCTGLSDLVAHLKQSVELRIAAGNGRGICTDFAADRVIGLGEGLARRIQRFVRMEHCRLRILMYTIAYKHA